MGSGLSPERAPAIKPPMFNVAHFFCATMVICPLTLFAADKPTENASIKTGRAVLQSIEKKYQTSKGTSMLVKKTLKLKLLNREKVSKGQIELLPPGRMRLELVDEQLTTFLIDGKKAWLIEFEDATGKTPASISSSRNPKQLQSQALAGFLLGKGEFLKRFALDSYLEEGGVFTAVLSERGVPKTQTGGSIKVQGSAANKQLARVEIVDEIENVTSYEFSEAKFNQKIPASRFKYAPPKGAEVSEF